MALTDKMRKFLRMIDFENTLFGLPFAYLGSVLAAGGWPGFHTLFWVTMAMFTARTSAMCLNRLIDRRLDRLNPRTSHWVMAREELPVPVIWGVAILLSALLVVSAAQLNPLCLKLSPLAVLILWGYSYTKRFTWLCHLILGAAIGIGPVGGWFAVSGTFDWQPFLLAAAVATWVGGFDALYACQDIVFDREHGLYSIPARFGIRGAFIIVHLLHLGTVFFLVLSGLALGLGWRYLIGVAVTAAILLYEHLLVRPDDLSRMGQAAFQLNHYVSSIIFICTCWDLWA